MCNNFTVYMHKNKINGKIYIGITSQRVQGRWNNGKGYKKNGHFYRAINYYGWDNFEHIILFENLSKEDACQKEIDLIKKYNTTNPDYGYNISIGGDVNTGWKHSDEYKNRMSEIMKNRTISDKTRKKISESRKGTTRILSQKEKQRIKEMLIERNKSTYMRNKIKESWIKRKQDTESYQEYVSSVSKRKSGKLNQNYGRVLDKNYNAKLCICDLIDKPVCQKEMQSILCNYNISITGSRLSAFLNMNGIFKEGKDLSYKKFIELSNLNLRRVG